MGQSVLMNCTVYRYPETGLNAEIVGPPGFNETGTHYHGLYTAEYVIEISQVNVDHSGNYTCLGRLALTLGEEAGQERLDDVIKKKLVVYGELH